MQQNKEKEINQMSVSILFVSKMTRTKASKPVCGGVRALGGEY